jgi:hypothetical protein
MANSKALASEPTVDGEQVVKYVCRAQHAVPLRLAKAYDGKGGRRRYHLYFCGPASCGVLSRPKACLTYASTRMIRFCQASPVDYFGLDYWRNFSGIGWIKGDDKDDNLVVIGS